MRTDDIETINAPAAELATTEAEIAQRYGFKADDAALFFAKGTALYDSGVAYAQESAKKYAALPTVDAVAAQHVKTIAGEQRRDRVIEPAAWRLDDAGTFKPMAPLTVEGKNGAVTVEPNAVAVSLNQTAFSQLGQRQATLVDALPPPWDPGYADALIEREKVPADVLKAWNAPRGNVNAWIGKVTGGVKARVRNAPDGSGRQMFAAVSSRYVPFDGDAVLSALAKAMPGTKCEMSYDADSTRTKARILIESPVDVPSFIGVGRVHQAGIQISTRDDGMSSIVGSGFLVRVRCRNHSLVKENTNAIKRRHTGSLEGLHAELSRLLSSMPEMIAELSGLWARKAADHYLDTDGTQLSVEEALTRLVAHGHVPHGGLKTEQAVENYMAAWRAEETPTSAAGILMAVQRAAHEGSWRTKWATDEIEESASALLYQTVSVRLSPAADRAPLEMS